MNKTISIYRAGYSTSPQKADLMVKVCGRMVSVLDVTLETILVESFGEVAPGDVGLTLYPVDESGKVLLDFGIAATAKVIGRQNGSIRLAFRTSTYPLSKLIIRCLALRQGIEPYHAKIGL